MRRSLEFEWRDVSFAIFRRLLRVLRHGKCGEEQVLASTRKPIYLEFIQKSKSDQRARNRVNLTKPHFVEGGRRRANILSVAFFAVWDSHISKNHHFR